jgi:hypothetical protein
MIQPNENGLYIGKSGHSICSPSSAKVWGECPGSVVLVEEMPELSATDPQSLGTQKHLLCHEFIKTGKLDDNAPDDVRFALQLFNKHLMPAPANRKYVTENKLIVPGYEVLAGTPDLILIDSGIQGVSPDAATIVDFKFGFEPVPIEESYQLEIYAGLLCYMHPYDYIRVVIIQPNNPYEPYQDKILSRASLLVRLDYHKERANRALGQFDKVYPHLTYGNHCGHCNAKGLCPEFAKQTESREIIQISQTKDIVLSNEQLQAIFLRKSDINKLLKSVEEVLLAKALAGEKLDFVELAGTPSRRVWLDDIDAVAQGLVDAGVENPFKKVLINVTDAEEVVPPEQLEKLITRTIPNPCLKPKKDAVAKKAIARKRRG